MPFSVYINKKAAKYLDEIDQKIKERIKEAMKFLQTNPVPIEKYDVIKLEGKEHTYRIRIGKYRIIYDVLWNEKTIWVLIVDRRGDETYKF